MICKNCANIYSDDLSCCPECGTPAKSGSESELKRPEFGLAAKAEDKDIERIISLAVSEQAEKENRSEALSEKKAEKGDGPKPVKETAREEIAEEIAVDEPSQEVEAMAEDIEKKNENTVKKVQKKKAAPPVKDKKAAKKSSQKGKKTVRADKKAAKAEERPVPTVRSEQKKVSKKERSAINFIISLMVVLIIIMAALAGISIFTDVFEKDGDDVKTVALSGLSGEDTEALEEYLAKIGIVVYEGFDSEKTSVGEFIDHFNPSYSGGLYNSFYGNPTLTVNEADPNGRFTNENGDYSFYVVKEQYVDDILVDFGYEINHNINEKNHYYFNGSYYFANLTDDNVGSEIQAEVSSTKRIQDGSYYAVCSFFDSSISGDDKNYVEAYIILDKLADGGAWKILRISHEPLFDQSGMMIKSDEGNSDLSYEMREEVIEGVAEDGTVYSRTVIEYPYFKGDSQGEKLANNFFTELIKDYTDEAEDADKDYKKFIKKGDKEDLPYVTRVISKVTYNRNGYLSIIQDTTDYEPMTKAQKENLDENEDAIAPMPERTVEGYTIEVETGEFVSKDAIIGKDYQKAHELLYRIYGGYEYESVTAEDGETTAPEGEEIPKDTDGIGKTIYESGNALGDSGYIFCYVNEKGYTEKVIIPYTLKNFFTKTF